MGTQYNTDLSKELNDVLKIQQAVDNIPQKYEDKIIPVVDVNPKHSRICNFVSTSIHKSTTGNHTVFTTPNDKDFYLCSLSAEYVKDVVCDSATGSYAISCYIDGAIRYLHLFPIIALTAQTSRISLSLLNPIKIDRNTSIVMGGTFTAGVCIRSCSITGYTLDNIRA